MTAGDAALLDAARELGRRMRAGELPAGRDGEMAPETRRAVADAGLDGGDDLALCLQVTTAVATGCPFTAWQLAGADRDAPDAVVQARIAAVALGAALGALDDFEAFVRARVAEPVPAPPDDPESDYRRWLGTGMAQLETARLVLDAAARADEATRLRNLSREAARMAYVTVQDLLVHVAGSRPDLDRLAATAAAMRVLWSHPLGADDDRFSRQIARERLQIAGG